MFSRRTLWNLHPNAFSRALEGHRSSGKPLLDLTASNPTAIGLKFESEAILSALSQPQSLLYEPASKGILPAREAVADYYRSHDLSLTPDQIILTVSTSEAYSYCFRLLCDPGDEVLVAVPSYPLFEFLADIQDVKLVPYELVYDYGWQIDFHSLERAITGLTRAILVVHPNNPTGSYVKPEELNRLSSIARQHELALIVDEVFLDYSLLGKPFSFACNSEVLTFTLSGLSKISCLPQMKLAWIVTTGPEDIKADALGRLDVIADTYLSPSAPIQWAARSMLDTRHNVQRQLMQRIQNNLEELDLQLGSQRLCTRLQLDAGWYATLRVPVTRSDEELAIELLRQCSVLVHPGHFFDYCGEGFLILSLISPEADFHEGLRRILGFFLEPTRPR